MSKPKNPDSTRITFVLSHEGNKTLNEFLEETGFHTNKIMEDWLHLLNEYIERVNRRGGELIYRDLEGKETVVVILGYKKRE